MNQLNLDKQTFYAYCLYTQQQRGYKSNWAFVIVKVQFGEWVDKKMKAETEAQQPTQAFYNWLSSVQANYIDEQREEKETKLQASRAKSEEFFRNYQVKDDKPKKPRKPPKHDIDRQMREIGEKLAKEGKDFTHLSNEQLNKELRAWHINEYYIKKLKKDQ